MNEPHISANLSEELVRTIHETAELPPHNVILNLAGVAQMDREAADALVVIRQELYVQERSFVVCALQPAVMDAVTGWELEEALNVTPTESEAWDIVQMDEIEREFLRDEGEE
ncbi:MAG: STAS domain-containing protein [Dinghuibacter sp.]|nr:STAS domain-containing protein [Dinghuibacter sp.]